MDFYPANQRSIVAPDAYDLCCPACRQVGSLQILGDGHDVQFAIRDDPTGPWRYVRWCLRRCPNSDCSNAVLVLGDNDGKVLGSWSPEIIDFDETKLPVSVSSSLDEVIACHASGCYRAAAIMIRRTLEDVCSDRNAPGPNLNARLAALAGKNIIPSELIEGLDKLRILDNDAAHIEAESYDQVGKDEVDTAIEVLELLLLAIYQYGAIVDRLSSHKH